MITYLQNQWRAPLILFTISQGTTYTKLKINLKTDESNSRNEMWHRINDEIGVVLQSWLWVRVQLIAW